MRDLLHIPAAELEALGVIDWGYTTELKPRSFERFEAWLPSAQDYLPFLRAGKSRDYRSDLKVWWPEAQSALVFLFTYAPAKKALLERNQHQLAAYSLGFDGRDYHPVLKERLASVAQRLQEQYSFDWKYSHDTEPILERDLAHRAGLGWFGKNSMLIHRQHGSYFLLGSLILNRSFALQALSFDTDHCGQCRLCVDACPTQAIDPETRTLKAQQCISAWTIEDRAGNSAPPIGLENSRGEVFGCDICQDVCPWNQRILEKITAHLGPGAQRWLSFFTRDVGEIAVQLAWITNRAYLRLTEGTVFGRPGRKALLRTLAFWMKR